MSHRELSRRGVLRKTVIRTIEYCGDAEWVDRTLENSLVRTGEVFSGGEGRTIREVSLTITTEKQEQEIG